jgi:RIO kinase 2
MSAADVAVRSFRKLQPEDLKILHAVEKQTKKYQNVPQDIIARIADLPQQDVYFRLPHLAKNHLITRFAGPYTGYHLTTAGYDTLAISHLVATDVLEAFGKPLGVGKEANVYDALMPDKTQVAVKFHRLGRTSFKQTKRKRGYGAASQYTPDWHQQSTIAAKNEHKALKQLQPHSVAAPEPIAQNRHALVMSRIEGVELYRCKEIPNPNATLQEVLDNIRQAYQAANIIHADLSPYNIILQPSLHILIIDWPQYIRRQHPNAEQLLQRDISNILKFFKSKYTIEMNLRQATTYIEQPVSTQGCEDAETDAKN